MPTPYFWTELFAILWRLNNIEYNIGLYLSKGKTYSAQIEITFSLAKVIGGLHLDFEGRENNIPLTESDLHVKINE